MATPSPRHAVAGAVETLLARRLGRLFLPLGGLLAVGVAWTLLGSPADRRAALFVAAGAPLAGLSGLAHGLRTVRRVLGGGFRSWTAALSAGGAPVWIYGLAALGTGLRGTTHLAGSDPWVRGAPALAVAVLAALQLRAWWRVSEVGELVHHLEHLPDADP